MVTTAAVCMAGTACSRRLMTVLVDLPPERSSTASPQGDGSGVENPLVDLTLIPPELLRNPADTVTPPIELTLDPDSVLALLPADHAGNVDWAQALRDSIIRPRNGIDGPRISAEDAFQFKFDFYFPGPNPTFDAYFPHSAHTQIIDCAQCHPRIFKVRGAEIKMADVLQGRFCGECHGTVAFNPTSACERCHTGMPLPPGRAQKVLTGTIEMRRAAEILAEQGDSSAAPFNTGMLPRARFPHWVHRIRYQCKTCHLAIFEPEAGANPVTMDDIANGRACGQCHDGTTAFIPSISNCEACHPEPSQVVGG